MLLNSARTIAEDVMSQLAPHCERIEIAGSIRRRKPDVGDIEIVLIPKGKMYPQKPGRGGLPKPPRFVPCMAYIDVVSQWHKVRGEAWDKATNRFLCSPKGEEDWNINLDIFTANVNNWGYIMAIRTGSAEYSHKVLATGWVKKGYHGEGGYLNNKNGEMVVILEEKELFALIGIPYVEPWDRNL